MSFMGTSMLLAAASRPLLNKIPPAVGLALVIFLFLITEDIGSGRIGIGAFELFKLPDFLYRGRIMTYLGFTEEGFYSADYFPLFPWFFLFLTGYYLNMLLKDTKIMNLFEKGVAPLNFPGRHSLIIYMLHQPVIYAVLIMDFFINRL